MLFSIGDPKIIWNDLRISDRYIPTRRLIFVTSVAMWGGLGRLKYRPAGRRIPMKMNPRQHIGKCRPIRPTHRYRPYFNQMRGIMNALSHNKWRNDIKVANQGSSRPILAHTISRKSLQSIKDIQLAASPSKTRPIKAASESDGWIPSGSIRVPSRAPTIRGGGSLKRVIKPNSWLGINPVLPCPAISNQTSEKADPDPIDPGAPWSTRSVAASCSSRHRSEMEMNRLIQTPHPPTNNQETESEHGSTPTDVDGRHPNFRTGSTQQLYGLDGALDTWSFHGFLRLNISPLNWY